MCGVYRIFSEGTAKLDFSKKAMLEAYYSESFGDPCSQNNGYLVGKKWMNVTLEMWYEDLRNRLLYKFELYDDVYPHWWLDKVLKGR